MNNGPSLLDANLHTVFVVKCVALQVCKQLRNTVVSENVL